MPETAICVFPALSTGNESVPIQLAQCWFTGLAISNAKIEIYFSNKIYGSNFVKQHSERLWFDITIMLISVKKINLLCYLLQLSAHFRSLMQIAT